MNIANRTVNSGLGRIKDISQAWLVLLLATCFGALLSGIDLTLSPTIEANKLDETLKKVPALVQYQSGADKLDIQRMFVNSAGKGKTYPLFHATAGDRSIGWVAKASGQGYADKVEVLIGLDPGAEKITGLFVLDQKETPGLGSKIVDPQWRGQFVGKDASVKLTAVKNKASAPGEIDAITGATISSRTVCDIVNKSLADLRKPLAEMAARAR